MTASVSTEPRMLIGGEWVSAETGERFETIDPSTGTTLASVPAATRADVDRAVRAAGSAAPTWARMSARKRGQLLIEAAKRVRAAKERIASLDAVDGGMPLKAARADVAKGAEKIEYFAQLAQEVKGETFPVQSGSFTYSLRQPYGVVAVVNPFNHPAAFTLGKAAAPLAAGNTVVVKPPAEASLSSLEVAAAMADVLPPGVFNVITGRGHTAGAALVGHAGVGKISFTGSVATGQAILRAAARNVVPAVLELGGKNANVVFADAEMEPAVAGAIAGMSLSVCGQSCQSGTRLFLHRDIHDEFIERLVAKLEQVRIGIASDEATQMGPLISAHQLEIVRSYIESGHAQGARLVTGGSRPTDETLRDGFFIRPTVFDGVDMTMKIAREEIFGPVLSVFTWQDEREMLKAVNAVEYGLTATIWSEGVRAHDLAREIEVGYVYINKERGGVVGLPFAGWKHSGLGLAHSREPLLDWTRIKIVDVRADE
jgi:betaine-aldehyde dehydrogenase